MTQTNILDFIFGIFPFPTDGSVNEDVVITKPFGKDHMTCREIRRNSAGCIKLREECEKCKAIQSIGNRPLWMLCTVPDHPKAELLIVHGKHYSLL